MKATDGITIIDHCGTLFNLGVTAFDIRDTHFFETSICISKDII